MKIENLEKVNDLRKQLNSINDLLEMLSNERLCVGISGVVMYQNYFHTIEAAMDSKDKIANAAWNYAYECRIILLDQKKELIKEIESL